MSISSSVVYCTGLLTLIYIALQLLRFTYTHIIPSFNSLGRYSKGSSSTQPYALVTGSTDGIGLSLASDLARRGFNLVLLSRNPTKLSDTRKSLLNAHPNIKIETLAIDVLQTDPNKLAAQLQPLASLPITILINNIGGYPPLPSPQHAFYTLDSYSASDLNNLITLNAIFMSHLTRLLLPQLAKSGPSLILNISSGAQVGIPRLVPYSASKGYVHSFSVALARECRTEGLPIDVLNVVVGDVQTKSNYGPVTLAMPSSNAYARTLLDRVGRVVSVGGTEMSPYIPHAFFIGLLEMLPELVVAVALKTTIREKVDNLDKTK